MSLMDETKETETLWEFHRATLDNGHEVWVIHDSAGGVRVASDVEVCLYKLLRETTRRAMSPALKERIWAVIGERDD